MGKTRRLSILPVLAILPLPPVLPFLPQSVHHRRENSARLSFNSPDIHYADAPKRERAARTG